MQRSIINICRPGYHTVKISNHNTPASGICVLAHGTDNLGWVKYNTGESQMCIVVSLTFVWCVFFLFFFLN